MKLGKEVEGRLKGLYTLFMDGKEARTFFEFKSLKERAFPLGSADSIEEVEHIYVSDLDSCMTPDAECFAKWKEFGLKVTLEVDRVSLREDYPDNVTVMLNVTDNSLYASRSFWRLLPNDQVKFVLPVEDSFMVRCVTVGSMTMTAPEDFAGDIEFVARTDDRFKYKE